MGQNAEVRTQTVFETVFSYALCLSLGSTMPSLSKRPNGVYFLYFYDATKTPKRKGISTGHTNRRKAEEIARELASAYQRGQLDVWQASSPSLPVESVPTPHPSTKRAPSASVPAESVPATYSESVPALSLERFYASRSNLSPISQGHYRTTLGILCRFLGSEARTLTATTEDLQAFFLSHACKPVTQHYYRRHFRAFYRWLQKHGVRREDPTEHLRLDRAPSKFPRFLTPEDVEAFCRAAEQMPEQLCRGGKVDPCPIVRANVFMGLRLSEVVNLRWEDVDLNAGRLFVRCSAEFTTKSGKDRCIPLSKSLLALLSALPRRSVYVFTTVDGSQIKPSTLSKTFHRIAQHAKLHKSINFHSTRHTAASWLAQRGVGVEAIRMLLGHSSITVTQRYMHLSPDAFEDAIKAAFG